MALTTAERTLVKQAAELITRETNAGEKVQLNGFGLFKQIHKAARTARNPKTGEAIPVAAKTVVTFKAAKSAAKA